MGNYKSRCDFTGCVCLGDSCRRFGGGNCSWNEETINRAQRAAEAAGELQTHELNRLLDEDNSKVFINRALAGI